MENVKKYSLFSFFLILFLFNFLLEIFKKKNTKKNLLVLPIEEISLWPELRHSKSRLILLGQNFIFEILRKKKCKNHT